MIIGRDFVFVLPPKSASTSISAALLDHGVQTLHRHQPLERQPPHPIVAAVVRDHDEMLRSALRRDGPWIAYGKTDIRDVPRGTWMRFVTFPLDFNNLDTDWRRFCDLVGIHVDLPHLNKRATDAV